MAPSLILLGFMGSGKTAVGQELAGRMGLGFRDADQLIEERSGMTVTEIFSNQGEAGFRRQEEATVLDLLDAAESAGGMVISLGGGAVTSERLRDRLNEEPRVVLLDSDLESAYHRSQDGSRPLARDFKQFSALFQERRSLYEKVARFRIDTRGKSVRQVADAVMHAIGERNEDI